MTAIGLAMGGNARTGMEDTLMLRRGVPAESNAQLVERLRGVARSIEREPATVEQANRAAGTPRPGVMRPHRYAYPSVTPIDSGTGPTDRGAEAVPTPRPALAATPADTERPALSASADKETRL